MLQSKVLDFVLGRRKEGQTGFQDVILAGLEKKQGGCEPRRNRVMQRLSATGKQPQILVSKLNFRVGCLFVEDAFVWKKA